MIRFRLFKGMRLLLSKVLKGSSMMGAREVWLMRDHVSIDVWTKVLISLSRAGIFGFNLNVSRSIWKLHRTLIFLMSNCVSFTLHKLWIQLRGKLIKFELLVNELWWLSYYLACYFAQAISWEPHFRGNICSSIIWMIILIKLNISVISHVSWSCGCLWCSNLSLSFLQPLSHRVISILLLFGLLKHLIVLVETWNFANTHLPHLSTAFVELLNLFLGASCRKNLHFNSMSSLWFARGQYISLLIKSVLYSHSNANLLFICLLSHDLSSRELRKSTDPCLFRRNFMSISTWLLSLIDDGDNVMWLWQTLLCDLALLLTAGSIISFPNRFTKSIKDFTLWLRFGFTQVFLSVWNYLLIVLNKFSELKILKVLPRLSLDRLIDVKRLLGILYIFKRLFYYFFNVDILGFTMIIFVWWNLSNSYVRDLPLVVRFYVWLAILLQVGRGILLCSQWTYIIFSRSHNILGTYYVGISQNSFSSRYSFFTQGKILSMHLFLHWNLLCHFLLLGL